MEDQRSDQGPADAVPLSGADRRERARADAARRAHHDAIFTLARAAEAHDEETGAHVLRIRLIVERIALQLGFETKDAEDLGYDAMLHDIGKLHIPHDVLRKPAALTPYERQVMESHTVRGERLLADQPTMRRASRIARSHHEAWDGSGYPDGLRGKGIPLEARITSAADVLDALIAERCYKQSWTYDQALREVVGLGGARIDPDVAEALRRCNADGSLSAVFGLPTQCAAP